MEGETYDLGPVPLTPNEFAIFLGTMGLGVATTKHMHEPGSQAHRDMDEIGSFLEVMMLDNPELTRTALCDSEKAAFIEVDLSPEVKDELGIEVDEDGYAYRSMDDAADIEVE